MKRKDTNTNDYDQRIPRELLKRIKNIEIRSRHLVNEALSGSYNSVFRGYGMEFEEVRQYFPGDDYRRIDWNVTARHNTPFMKRFREERQLNVFLLIDISGSLEYGSQHSTKRDQLAQTAAVLSFTALSNQDKIGALFFSDIVEHTILPSKNKNTILRLIRDILFYKPRHHKTNISEALTYAIKTMKRRGVIFILSDFFSQIDYKQFFIASRKHDIIPVVFSDIYEEVPVNIGLVDMIDNETGEQMLIDTNSPSYKRTIEKRKKDRDMFFIQLKKLRIEPLFISTEDRIEDKILKYFERRKKTLRT